MKGQRWKKIVIITGMAVLLLAGCQSNDTMSGAEIEALRQQITQLEQHVSSLEQQVWALGQQADDSQDLQETSTTGAGDVQQPSNPTSAGDTSSGSLTTHTIEELGGMIDAYAAKVNEAAPESMEQFFTLKQEAKQIDDTLDRHEDELELLYRSQSLTREEYNRREHELDRLEDKLDDAEDYLELVFGIDD